jgi:DNA recombination protein RmuC
MDALASVLLVFGVLGIAGLVGWLIARRTAGASPAPALPPADTAELTRALTQLSERIGAIERHQSVVRDGLTETAAVAAGLREASEAIRGDLARARQGLAELQAAQQARHDLEARAAQSLQRLEQVIAGTASKGGAGEQLVDAVFSRLPIEWQVRGFTVGNLVCEFGLRLPNGLVVPIDSKWPATSLVDALATEEDPTERQRLKQQLEQTVRQRAREVAKYLDPDLTAGFAIAVVPDAVDELAGAAKADCLRLNVVLIGQGMLVPYLLLVFQTALRASSDIDVERLVTQLDAVEKAVQAIQDEVEGRMSKAITMLANARDDLRGHVAGARSGIVAARARSEAALPGVPDDFPAIEESAVRPLIRRAE